MRVDIARIVMLSLTARGTSSQVTVRTGSLLQRRPRGPVGSGKHHSASSMHLACGGGEAVAQLSRRQVPLGGKVWAPVRGICRTGTQGALMANLVDGLRLSTPSNPQGAPPLGWRHDGVVCVVLEFQSGNVLRRAF